MEVVFLGTGTSQGVPMIACDCDVCRSDDLRDKRSRTSIHVVMGGHHIQVDASPEFREQCLRHRVQNIDTFILTHGHADHVLGMDDLRRFCDLRSFSAIPVFSTPQGQARVREIYPYAIGEKPVQRGYPAFILADMPPVLDLGVGTVTSVLLPHGEVSVLGLIFEERATGAKFAYYTDCKSVDEEARARARGAQVVVLDGLRPEPHPTHMSISEATAVASAIAVPMTYLIHLTHAVPHAATEAALPLSVRLAWDGLRLTL